MTWLSAHILVVCISIAMALSSLVILGQRRSPQATIAWLLFLVMLPYFALPVFLLLGFRKRPDAPAPSRDATRLSETAFSTSRVRALCEHYGFLDNAEGNAFRLLRGPIEAWQALDDLVRNAGTTLDVTLYVLGPDDVGRAFCAALEARARAGVQVRVILDSIGSFHRPSESIARLKKSGANVRFYSPLVQKPTGGHLNLRNHRKMVIADGARVWTGGRNVATEYLGPVELADRWRDLSCLVEGPVAKGYCETFESDWAKVGGRRRDLKTARPQAGRSSLGLIPSGPDMADDALHDAIVVACHETRSRLWIVTPYFLPTPTLMEALTIAARRSVDVRVLVPERSNQRLADLARGPSLRDLHTIGVHIHRHPHMVHAKAVLTDDSAFVGSANFDARSLLLNHEIMLLVMTSEDIASITAWAEKLVSEATPGLPHVSRIQRAMESVFRLVSPVL